MSWNYRVIRSIVDGTLGVHEVYYGPNYISESVSWTEDAVTPTGDSLEELRHDLEMMLTALSKPIMREVKDGDQLRLEEEGT